MYLETLDSPLGLIRIEATDRGIRRIDFVTERETDMPNGHTSLAREQLEQYFKGKRRLFTFSCESQGTAFQKAVWEALRNIPYGETATYGEIARRVGRPRAVRAVGQANRVNPLALVVPCHRVVGVNGRLTGYAGGLEKKQYLLELEQRTAAGGELFCTP